MFGMIGGVIGKMLGSDKALGKAVDSISSGLDKMVYTDEEKADANAAATTEARQFVVDWMRASSGQNLARRMIALTTTAVWLLQYILMNVMSIVSIWMDDPFKVIAAIKVMAEYSATMKGAVMLILGFYFAPHIPGIAMAAMKKFNSK